MITPSSTQQSITSPFRPAPNRPLATPTRPSRSYTQSSASPGPSRGTPARSIASQTRTTPYGTPTQPARPAGSSLLFGSLGDRRKERRNTRDNNLYVTKQVDGYWTHVLMPYPLHPDGTPFTSAEAAIYTVYVVEGHCDCAALPGMPADATLLLAHELETTLDWWVHCAQSERCTTTYTLARVRQLVMADDNPETGISVEYVAPYISRAITEWIAKYGPLDPNTTTFHRTQAYKLWSLNEVTRAGAKAEFDHMLEIQMAIIENDAVNATNTHIAPSSATTSIPAPLSSTSLHHQHPSNSSGPDTPYPSLFSILVQSGTDGISESTVDEFLNSVILSLPARIIDDAIEHRNPLIRAVAAHAAAQSPLPLAAFSVFQSEAKECCHRWFTGDARQVHETMQQQHSRCHGAGGVRGYWAAW